MFNQSKNDKYRKRQLISINMYQSRFGLYKNIPVFPAMKVTPVTNFKIGQINNTCNVFVINKHPLDIVSEFVVKGSNYMLHKGIFPVLINTVGQEFSGTNYEANEGIRDDSFNLRTNFNNTTTRHNPYPIKDNECVYSKCVTVIRNPTLYGLSLDDIYHFSLITAIPVNKPKMIDDTRMMSTEYIKTMNTIDCIFQVAMANFHNMIILSPFGANEDENPQEDIIKLYNWFIFKYGHKFKYIIIAVPPQFDKKVFELFDKNIIKHQDLVKSIEDKYSKKEVDEMIEEKTEVQNLQKLLHKR